MATRSIPQVLIIGGMTLDSPRSAPMKPDPVSLNYPPDQAIVVGGSIAGLLAARVLTEHFAQVTIVERDHLPADPQPRPGVSQSVQPHILLTKGYRILTALFPEIEADLTAAGALKIDWAQEFDLFSRGNWNPPTKVPSDLVSVTCSRPLLEWILRQRVGQIPQVKFLQGSQVQGLLYDAQQHRITGVKCLDQELSAQLVVDASGRSSQTPRWLKELGLAPPEETIVNPFLGYATRRYRPPQGYKPDWKVMLINQQPPDNPRLGYIAQIEGHEWIVTLGGYGRDFPPDQEQGFLGFAHSLPSPRFYELIQAAQPLSPIYPHRATANRQRHYEKIMLPAGFVVLGDAACAFCPVYGQGMTVSALAALELRDWLQKGDRRSSPRFQQALAKQLAFSWAFATGQDSGFATTAGRQAPRQAPAPLRWYFKRIGGLAKEDPEIHSLFLQVGHLLKSPSVFYQPRIILKVLSRGKHPKAAFH